VSIAGLVCGEIPAEIRHLVGLGHPMHPILDSSNERSETQMYCPSDILYAHAKKEQMCVTDHISSHMQRERERELNIRQPPRE